MKALYDYIVAKIKGEPAVIVGAVASALVVVAASLNVVIDQASLEAVLSPLVLGLITRLFVSPANA